MVVLSGERTFLEKKILFAFTGHFPQLANWKVRLSVLPARLSRWTAGWQRFRRDAGWKGMLKR